MNTNPFKKYGPHRWGYYFLQGYNAHTLFCRWVKDRQKRISTALEIGCGYFEYYSYFFGSLNIEYTGLDLLKGAVKFRKKLNPECDFIQADFTQYKSDVKYDLVFSHMLLSGILEEETNLLMIKSKVELSERYGFAVLWNTDKIDPDKWTAYLKELGCKNINHFTMPVGIPEERVKNQLIIYWER